MCTKDCNECFDTSFITLPTGDTGLMGPQGLQGLQGPQGEQGIQGLPGSGIELVYFSATPIIDSVEIADYNDIEIINLPTLSNNGDSYKMQFVYTINSAPISNGFGLYFFMYTEGSIGSGKYIHPNASNPTYGNSVIKLPYDKVQTIIEIELTKYNNTETYIVIKQTITDGFDGVLGTHLMYYNTDVNLTTFNRLKLQVLHASAGSVNREMSSIYKYNG